MDNLLYQMKLHDVLNFDYFIVTRVPGGWVYTQTYFKNVCSVFVPYSNEFYVNNIKE
jgi:hypothetical protein